jgi:hypothetical protein
VRNRAETISLRHSGLCFELGPAFFGGFREHRLGNSRK